MFLQIKMTRRETDRHYP